MILYLQKENKIKWNYKSLQYIYRFLWFRKNEKEVKYEDKKLFFCLFQKWMKIVFQENNNRNRLEL